jgi:DNA-binding NarL/FixJ family response regulator
VRAGYRQFLKAEPIIHDIGETASGVTTLDALRQTEWNLLLMEIQLPDRSGLDILHEVIKGHPSVRVLMMSGHAEDHYARHVLRAGAYGYLKKSESPQEFLVAIRAVLGGHRYVSAALAHSIASKLAVKHNLRESLHSELSQREFQIFCKLVAGDSVGAIAQGLRLSAKTVSSYRSRVLRKMDLHTTADLMAYAFRHRLIQ